MDAAFQPKQATGVGLDWKSGVGCGWLRRIGLHKGSFFNWITSYRRVHTRMPTFFPSICLLVRHRPLWDGRARRRERRTSSLSTTTTRKMPLECPLPVVPPPIQTCYVRNCWPLSTLEVFRGGEIKKRREGRRERGWRRERFFLSWYVL